MFEAAGTSNVTEHNEQRTNFNSTPVAVGPRPHYWGRPLAIAAAVVFFISLVFPVTAGLWGNKASFPRWWGPLDVGIAFVLQCAFDSLLVLLVESDRNSCLLQRAVPHRR